MIYSSIFVLRSETTLRENYTMKQTKVTFNSEKLRYSAELMRAIAHPLRLRILEYIDDQEVTQVNKIYNSLHIEQSICSQHLKTLRLAGVLTCEKEGKYMKYSINYEVVRRAKVAVDNFLRREALVKA